jgi:phosphohistidine phosphatase
MRCARHRQPMLTLSLLRHAKSSWDKPGLDDYDRPLAKRGKKAAPEIGAALAAMGLRPDLVLCSGAVRARETLDLVLPKLGPPPPEIVYDDAIYMATPATLLARLRAIAASTEWGTPRHVLLVGHNPGMEELALLLIGSGAADDTARMAEKFPTAAVAVVAFNAEDWSGIKPGAGRLEHFLTPKGLA